MKNLKLLAALLATASLSVKALPTYDSFNYTAGQPLIGQVNPDGLTWFGINTSTSTTNASIANPGNIWSTANLPANFPAPSSNAVVLTGNYSGGAAAGGGGNLVYGSNVTSGSIYASFYLNVTDTTGIGGTGAFWATFNSETGTAGSVGGNESGRIIMKGSGTTYQLGITKSSGTASQWVIDPTLRNQGDTLFVVCAYTFVSPSNDVFSLWVNPSVSDFGASTAPTPTITVNQNSATSAGDIATVRGFALLNRNTGSNTRLPNTMYVDDLHLGQTWAYVTGAAQFTNNPPATANLALGSNVVLNAAATSFAGAPALSYRWQKNGANLSDGATVIGSTTTSLTLTNVTSSDAATYACVAANSIGTVSSASCVVKVLDPVILQQPPAITNAPPGSTAVLSITASGTPTLSYSWQKNGANMSDGGNVTGSKTANLSLSNISSADNGTYGCVVQNGVGASVTSSNCVFSVTDPAITTQPQSASVNYGSIVIFNTAATGTGPFSYSWQYNGSAMTDGTTASGATASGSTSPSLTLTGVAFSDSGSYSVVVTGASGSATSVSATLAVKDPYIVNQPVDSSTPPGQNAIFHVDAAGTGPITYKWRRGTTTLTDGGQFSGTTTDTLTISGVVDTNAASYNVIVSGIGATNTSSNAVLTVTTPAAIVTPLVSRAQHAGENTSLSAAVVGLPPITYTWTKNGNVIAGASTNSIAFTNITSANNGTYTLTVANQFGTNSSTATVTVSPGYMRFFPGNIAVTRVGDGIEDLNPTDGNTLSIDQYTPNGACVSTVTLADDTNVNSAALIVAGADTTSGAAGLGEAVLGSSPDNHFLGVAGYNISRPSGATGSLGSLTVAAAPRAAVVINGLGYPQMTWRNNSSYPGGSIRSVVPDNTGSSFYTVGGSSGLRYVSGSTATLIDNIGAGANDRVVSYFNVNGSTSLYISTAAATSQGIYSYSPPLPTASTAPTDVFNTNSVAVGLITNQGQNEFSVSPDGNTIYFANGNFHSSTGSGVERWDNTGGWVRTYNFTTNANLGARGLYVDWSNFVPGGTGAIVYATTAQTNNNYLVKIVDNGADSPITILAQAGTNQVFRSVRAAPVADGASIVAQPQNQRAALGVKAVFSVSTAGTLPINYQWYKNGTLLNDGPSGVGSTITGATSSALTISGVVNADVASYKVVIGNAIGGATSSSATLAVVDPSNYQRLNQIWAQSPQSQTYLPADTDSQGRSPLYRSLAYNAVSNQLLIVSRPSGTPTITVLNASTGAALYTMNTTGVSGGYISLNAIACGDDGVVYATDVSTAGAASSNFKLYRWDNTDPASVPTAVYAGSTDPGMGNIRRWGDALSTLGSEPNTQIMLDAANADSTGGTTRGTIFSPSDIPWNFAPFSTGWTSSANDSIGRTLSFAPVFGTNAYIQKRKGSQLLIETYDVNAGTSTITGNYNNFTPSSGQLAFLTSNLAAAIDYSGGESSASAPDYVDLLDVSDLARPVIIGQYPFPTSHLPNGDYNGCVVATSTQVFALDSNNGVVAFTLGASSLPSLRAVASGGNVTISWNDTAAATGATLQYSTTLTSGSWVNDPSTVNTSNAQKSVTEPVTVKRFYRLIK